MSNPYTVHIATNLPHTDHVYKQALYQEVNDEEWNAVAAQMPSRIAWEDLGAYERGDNTSGSQTLACSGDSCEVVDLTSG